MSGNGDRSKERQFWRAMVPDEPIPVSPDKPVDLTHDLNDLDKEQREARRQALKSMLAANEARQKNALRNRRPILSVGQRVAVVNGKLAGKQGVVMDADFIHSKVLLEIRGAAEPLWISFKRIGSVLQD